MTRRRGEESKGKRPILPLISSLNVLQSPEHPKRFTELVEKRRGREEIEVTWGRETMIKRGESNQASITLLSKNWY